MDSIPSEQSYEPDFTTDGGIDAADFDASSERTDYASTNDWQRSSDRDPEWVKTAKKAEKSARTLNNNKNWTDRRAVDVEVDLRSTSLKQEQYTRER